MEAALAEARGCEGDVRGESVGWRAVRKEGGRGHQAEARDKDKGASAATTLMSVKQGDLEREARGSVYGGVWRRRILTSLV